MMSQKSGKLAYYVPPAHTQRVLVYLLSAFEKCIRTLVGQDVHMKSYTSEQGGCQEGSQGTQKGIPDFN